MNNQIMIAYLTKKIDVTEDYLAHYLGVTPMTLNNWKRLNFNEVSEKSPRLKRLFHAVQLIILDIEYSTIEIKNILDNSRVVIDPLDSEDGTISLIGYINSQIGEVSKEIIKNIIKEY